jgi:hypothetical protein
MPETAGMDDYHYQRAGEEDNTGASSGIAGLHRLPSFVVRIGVTRPKSPKCPTRPERRVCAVGKASRTSMHECQEKRRNESRLTEMRKG